jgi:hypothetical protein
MDKLKKIYHLFIPGWHYETLDYEDSFPTVQECFDAFTVQRCTDSGKVMKTLADGSLEDYVTLNADRYWDEGRAAYRYYYIHDGVKIDGLV